ncbi:hypothetical protein I6J77_15140 [Rhodanobacter sp. FDAARGOS 1247]|uniref:putative Ig domain-containing protein n=1 Tax=Rhodanobacter sp. FDAARGOS 1247 TaxID=2778082 RepID=UPI00194F49A8|nr:putative Ig domain-containing protein [Rhodanobacter sp. FDAARGOS 1247]QRP63427.1 hypothetical protein I6J77_15140 [Rhodanobacter sp. FDAARGOS 1247]
MAISTDDYARMAADSYKSWPDGHAVDGTDFEVYKTLQNTTSGYYGAIYRNKITGELVVAHRGTEFDDNGTGTDILRDLVEADGQMALQRINQQIDDARHLVEIALDLAKHSSPSGGPVSVTVTGHSLGGSLAQVTAFEYGLYGETFNAYGAAGQYGTPAGGSQVINYVRATDLVAAAGQQFGEVRIYATATDRQLLLMPEFKLEHVITDLGPSVTHAIAQFIGGTDGYLLTPENSERYVGDRAIYDSYRATIFSTAKHLPIYLTAMGLGLELSVAETFLYSSYLYNKVVNVTLESEGPDNITGTDDRNYIKGGLGNDILTGGEQNDLIFGDRNEDTLRGSGGSDALYGGDDNDYLDGGAGSDQLEGGDGFDRYNFSLDDLAATPGSVDTIYDSDRSGQIEINNNQFSVGDRLSVETWRSMDGKFLVSADLSLPSQSLSIKNVTTGNVILVKDWSNGDLGITLSGQIPTPQTNSLSDQDDLFGNAGMNGGNDLYAGLAGDDGLHGGAGDDTLDGGAGSDLLFGGTGNDHLAGGDGNDFIIDGSELTDMEDWSDEVDGSGKSQRQRVEEDIMQLGSVVLAQGKGWYVRKEPDTAGGADSVVIVTAKQTAFLDPNVAASGDDIIDGGMGDDTILAGEGRDTIQGGAGGDELVGGADDDVIYGGADDDMINGDTPSHWIPGIDLTAQISSSANPCGNDLIDAGSGNDQVWGGGGNDIVYGGDGDDRLSGRGEVSPVQQGDTDADYIDGGIGNDAIYGDDGDDTLFGGDGNDQIRGDNGLANARFGNDILDGGIGDDLLMGDGGNDVLYGRDGADTLNGDSADIAGSLHGKDILDGGAGNDKLYGFGNGDVLYGGDGDDLLVGDADESQLAATYHGNDFLFGGAGNDELQGNGGNDVLDGGVGDDKLFGGVGDDVLDGGADEDELNGEDGNDRLNGGVANDKLWGGAGNDALIGGVGDDTLDGGAGNDSLSGGDGVDLLAGNDGDDVLDGGDGNDTIYGQGGNDTLNGGAGNDILLGGDLVKTLTGDDIVYGGAGDDDLTGGGGNDELIGGVGNDTYHFESGFGVDRILQVAGEDAGQDAISFGSSIQATALGYSLDGDNLVIHNSATGDVLTVRGYFGPDASISIHFSDGGVTTKSDLEQLLGLTTPPIVGSGVDPVSGTDGTDRIYGNDDDNTIYGLLGDDYINGGAGDDKIYGGPGNDTLEGGAGNDTYYIGDDALETIVGLGDSDAGSDTIVCDFLGSEVNNYQISGNDLYIHRGLAYPETLLLKGFLAEANGTHVIQFSDGSQLTAGNFRISPGDWTGTSGDDIFQGDSADNVLNGGVGKDTISGGAGNDRISTSDAWYGSYDSDVLRGEAGNDVLSDVDGTMYGGTGNDTYNVIGDDYRLWYNLPATIIENPDEGQDTLYTNAYDVKLPDNVENLVAKPSPWLQRGYGDSVDPRDLVGNDLDNVITVDMSSSNIHSDIVYRLDGGAGADTLNGSRYNDIYVVDNPNDVIVEPSTGDDQSFDIVQAKYSYHLDSVSNIEEVQLLGSEDISAWGTDAADVLDGNTSSGMNVLYGGAGDDQYVLGVLEGDTVVEDAAGGNDTVTLSLSMLGVPGTPTSFFVSDYANVENLTLSDTLFSLTGSAGGGNLNGNAYDNILTGNGYANVIHGGDGNDTVSGGHHGTSSSLFGSDQPDELYGDAGDDTLDASWGGGYLYGGAGNDTLKGGANSNLYGGLGNDSLQGGQGADTFHYDAGDGTDTIDSEPSAALDQIIFGANVSTNDVTFSRDGTTLIVQVGLDSANQLHVNNYWADVSDSAELTGSIDQFVFADGTVRRGGLDHLPYTNNPPVVHSSLEIEGFATQTLTYQLPNGVFTDALDDTLTYGLESNAPSWLSVDPTTGSLQGIVPNGGLDTGFYLTATDTWGQSAKAWVHLTARNLISGTDQADTLTGTSAKDDIHAGAGDDLIAGGAGDRLYGGTDNDTYVVSDSSIQIIENAGEGTDTVESSSDYVLGDGVENLILMTGTSANAGTGNALDNVITGNEQNNELDGGSGADRLLGGVGDDMYIVDRTDDVAIELAGEGTDTVRSLIDWTLGDNFERLELVGPGDLSGAGNALDNDLIGGSGDNYLAGGGGVDRLYGGQGDDYLVLETSGDQAFENQGDGNDTVERHFETNLTLADNVENLVLVGGALTGNGNNLSNTIAGSSMNNSLSGYAGDDTLEGQAGDDSIFGGAGADLLSGGDGADYLDGGDAEDRLQGGLGNDTLIGGAGNDLLEGGAGDDYYVFAGGSGSDVVDNAGGGNDGIFFQGGIDASRLTFARDGNDLVIFVDGAVAPTVRVADHFLGGDAAIAYVQPDGGNSFSAAQIAQMIASGEGGGPLYDQTVEGTAAAEQLVGGAGKDLVKGLAGDDQLFGLAGDDTLQGGDGDDYLAGGDGSSTGSGADRLEGGVGNDTLNGEDGINVLLGGAGDDSYVYGGGQDTIDNTGGGFDGVFFNDGITASQLGFSRDGDDLLITVDGDADSTLRVTNHFLGGDAAIDYVQPASGSMLNTAAINALVGSGSGGDGGGGDTGGDTGNPTQPGNDGDYTNTVDGTSAGEQLLGSNGRDLIHGLGGNDTIFGFGGDDKFDGGDGDDYLSGGNGSFSGSGKDILIGGAGVDTLVGEDGEDLLFGGAGNDKYIWQVGSGSDVIDNTGGGTDWLFFNGIDRTRLSFHRSGDDLIILVDGDVTQQVQVKNHFQGGDLAISYVQPSDGYAIPAADFADLLTPLPAGLATAVAPVSLVADESVAAVETVHGLPATGSRPGRFLEDGGHGHLAAGGRRWSAGYLTIDDEPNVASIRQHGAAFGHGIGISRQTQQLIEAMSRFHPASGEASPVHQDLAWEHPAVIAGHDALHRFNSERAAAML